MLSEFQTLITSKRFQPSVQILFFIHFKSQCFKDFEKKLKMALAGANFIAFDSHSKGRPLAIWTSTFNF